MEKGKYYKSIKNGVIVKCTLSISSTWRKIKNFEGVVVVGNDVDKVGDFSKRWAVENFCKCNYEE